MVDSSWFLRKFVMLPVNFSLVYHFVLFYRFICRCFLLFSPVFTHFLLLYLFFSCCFRADFFCFIRHFSCHF
ncbi:hypothetical protein C2G38_2113949, partial [Gigaspora rosea]